MMMCRISRDVKVAAIGLCWDKRRDRTDHDENRQKWDYRLASVSSRAKRMKCYYVV